MYVCVRKGRMGTYVCVCVCVYWEEELRERGEREDQYQYHPTEIPMLAVVGGKRSGNRDRER